VALMFAIAFTYWTGDSPDSNPPSTRARQPAPGTEVTGLPAPSKAGLSAVAGSEKQTETQQKAIAALRQEVTLLKREVSALQQVHEQWQAATGAAPGSAADSATDPRNDAAARAEAERAWQEQMAVLEASFRQEPVDRHWSFKATGAVQEALASKETVQTALQNLECRSQTCRMELAEDDTGELQKSMPLFLMELGETVSSVTANHIDDGAGGTTTILYLSRGADESPRS
jgi:hypothetical protein